VLPGVPALLTLLLIACVAISMHAVTGFGSALLLSPALLAFETPRVAVAAMTCVGLVINALIVVRGPRRGPQHVAPVMRLIPGAMLGLPLGLILLSTVSKATLQILIGAVVVVAVLVPAVSRADPDAQAAGGRGAEAACGVLSGVLTSSTGIGVTPIALWLGRRVRDAVALRYGIALYSVALTLGTLVLLVVTGGAELVRGVLLAAALAPAIVLGHWVGRRAFLRLDPRQFRAATLTLIVASGVASMLAGLQV